MEGKAHLFRDDFNHRNTRVILVALMYTITEVAEPRFDSGVPELLDCRTVGGELGDTRDGDPVGCGGVEERDVDVWVVFELLLYEC